MTHLSGIKHRGLSLLHMHINSGSGWMTGESAEVRLFHHPMNFSFHFHLVRSVRSGFFFALQVAQALFIKQTDVQVMLEECQRPTTLDVNAEDCLCFHF